MKKTKLFAALVVLSACGAPRPGPKDVGIESLEAFFVETPYKVTSKDFTMPCIGRVTSANPIHLRVLAFNLIQASEIFDVYEIMSPDQFCKTFGSVDLDFSADRYLPDEEGDKVIGRYDPDSDRITLNDVGNALGHEMLHHWEHVNGNIWTGWHPGWGDNGYWDVSTEYFRSCYDMF